MTAKKKGGSGSPFDALRPLRDELEKKAKETPSKKAAPKPPPRSLQPDLPEDETLLLHRMLSGVQPLARTPGRIPRQPIERSVAVERTAERGAEIAEADARSVREHLRSLVEEPARFEVTDDGRRVEGRRGDVPADRLRQLRRGQLPIDARLDLHGSGVHEARDSLEAFLRTTRSNGERCVLVIHGKGEHSPHGTGVLRGEIAAWLSQGTPSRHVAAFATAQHDDGGEGAVYVLLRQ